MLKTTKNNVDSTQNNILKSIKIGEKSKKKAANKSS